MFSRLVPLLAAAAMLPTAAMAQDVPDAAAEEAARLEEIERQMRENARQAELLRNRTEEGEAALADLRQRLVTIANSLQQAEADLTAIEATLERLDREEAEALEDLRERQRNISDVLAALQSLERSRPPALAVSPEDATEAAIAAIALAGVTPELTEEVVALREQLAQIDAIRAAQSRERASLDAAEASLNTRRALLNDAVEERQVTLAEDTARLRQIEAEDARLAREASTLRELIQGIAARTAAESRELLVLPGGPEAYEGLPARFSLARSVLPFPAAGQVAQAFGSPLDSGERSEQVTIETRPGAIVTAPFGGQVVWAEPFGVFGNLVIIDVGEGFSLLFWPLENLTVRRDQTIQAGEPLGRMGPATPGELNFQVRRNNVPVDPARWLQSPA